MSPDQKKRLFELFVAHETDSLTMEEHDEFQQTLRRDEEARRLWFIHQDIELGLRMLLATQPVMAAKDSTFTQYPNPHSSIWRQWRPLAAAAALFIALFTASVVFGFVIQRGGERRTPIAVFTPGFENTQISLANGFPSGPGQWSGDTAQIVTAENGVSPKEGRLMLRIEPMSKGVPRIYQVLDLQALLPSAGADSREIEISASFTSGAEEGSVRYVIRAFGFTESPESLDAGWFERRDESIVSSARGVDVMPGTRGWQTVSVKIQIPRSARSLVLFFGIRMSDKVERTVPHYLDDVHVSLLSQG